MITCKEDLVNTYIENDNGVLRDVYVSLCRLHGIKCNGYIQYDILHVTESYEQHGASEACADDYREDCKQLTLSDLLPTSYENTKVYSLDEDVIRKYAELCGVDVSKKVIKKKGEPDDSPNGAIKIEGINHVFYFTRDTDEKTLTTEQILAAWDLRFNSGLSEQQARAIAGISKSCRDISKSIPKYTESEYQAVVKECDSYKNACNLNSLIITDMDGNTVDFDTCEGVVELPFSLESLKQYKQPKTKTKFEYVKCEDSIFDLKDDYATGAIYYKISDRYEVASTEQILLNGYSTDSLYRRTEVEISERDLFIEEMGNLIPEFDKRTNKLWIGKIYDSGKFKLIN